MEPRAHAAWLPRLVCPRQAYRRRLGQYMPAAAQIRYVDLVVGEFIVYVAPITEE